MKEKGEKQQIALIAWARLSRRTRDLAQVLGAKLIFIPDMPPYLRAWIETKHILEKLRPKLVIAQLPQGPLLWRVLNLSKRLKYRVVADVHTSFVVHDSLKGLFLNRPFQHLLGEADLLMAHNEPQAKLIETMAGISREKILIVYDPLPIPPKTEEPPIEILRRKEYILLPASWASDEPIYEIVKIYIELGLNYILVLTNNPHRNKRFYKKLQKIIKNKPIILTGYLPIRQYAWVFQNAKAIIAATKREYTMLSSIWEAVAYKKPFLVLQTKTLKEILGNNYPCFFSLSSNSMKAAIEKCLEESIRREIKKVIEKLSLNSSLSLERLSKTLNKLCEEYS